MLEYARYKHLKFKHKMQQLVGFSYIYFPIYQYLNCSVSNTLNCGHVSYTFLRFLKNDKIYQFYTNLQAIFKIKYKFGSRKWDISPTAASKTNFPVKLEISYRDLYQFIEKVPEAI